MATRSAFRLPLFIIFLCLPALCNAQLWSGVLAPSRAVDWSSSGIAPGATITNRSAACSTQPSLASGSGSATANTSAINAAIIADIGGNCVINIAAGTWYVNGDICFMPTSGACGGGGPLSPAMNITFRGAGPDQTTISFVSGGSYPANYLIDVNNNDGSYSTHPSNIASWTAGYSSGTSSITLAALTYGSHAPVIGASLILDQCDTGLSGHSTSGTSFGCGTGTITDNGNFFVCGLGGTCATQGGTSGRPGRREFQEVTVQSVSGSGPYTVGISPAIYMPNFASGSSPEAWWSTIKPVSGVGIENITIDASAVAATTGGIIGFENATNSWVKNVRSINNTTSSATHKHVWMYQSTHITVRDSYFYGSAGQSESYGVDCSYSSSDNYVENNIFQHIASGPITEGCTGTVYGYNYSVDAYYETDTNWLIEGISHHSIQDSYNLFEGNVNWSFVADDIHGTDDFLTLYRNYLVGQGWNVTKTEQTSPVTLQAYNRYMNFVGNVLGNSTTQTNYQVAASSATEGGNSGTANQSIYVLGYSGTQGSYYSGVNNDTRVLPSLMRWGNADAATGFSSPRYCKSGSGSPCSGDETGSGASTYPGLAAPSTTFPASFYLSSGTPSWWQFPSGTTAPYPAIGPDVSSGNYSGTGGHAYLTPAANCYLNVMGGLTNGTSGVLTFNANNCYTTGSASGPPPPAPPVNLKAVVN